MHSYVTINVLFDLNPLENNNQSWVNASCVFTAEIYVYTYETSSNLFPSA